MQYNIINTPIPELYSSNPELQNAFKYYNKGILGIGSGFDVNSALANGVEPRSIYDAELISNMDKKLKMNDIANIFNVGSALANTYFGYRNYLNQQKLFDKQLKMADWQFKQNQDEVNRIKRVRSKLAQLY